MEEFWINPLGLDNITVVDGATSDPINYDEVVRNINVALRQIKDLKKFLIKEFLIVPDSIISQKQSLLKVDLSALNDVNTRFQEMYRTLQKFGAFLYYIIMKAADNNNDYYTDLLNETKQNMIQILCGIQTILLMSCQKPYSDYRYDDFLKIIKNSKFNEHNAFFIMREYEDFLNVIIRVKPSSKVQQKRKNSESIGHKKAKR